MSERTRENVDHQANLASRRRLTEKEIREIVVGIHVESSRGGGKRKPAVEKPAIEPAAQAPAKVEGASQVQDRSGRERRLSSSEAEVALGPRDVDYSK
jgi:hypothetical protein